MTYVVRATGSKFSEDQVIQFIAGWGTLSSYLFSSICFILTNLILFALLTVLCLCLSSKVHLYDSMEQGHGLLLEWVPTLTVAGVLIYITAFAIGMGQVPCVIMYELVLCSSYFFSDLMGEITRFSPLLPPPTCQSQSSGCVGNLRGLGVEDFYFEVNCYSFPNHIMYLQICAAVIYVVQKYGNNKPHQKGKIYTIDGEEVVEADELVGGTC
ncbi:hypothetical protein RIF29_38101 [Crotalaria pallida]|uniref:Uncharacterized protein n=1 Tax=Crotalaria pallida TaxID=3830 RepID=A0AAN9E1L1_CROPI